MPGSLFGKGDSTQLHFHSFDETTISTFAIVQDNSRIQDLSSGSWISTDDDLRSTDRCFKNGKKTRMKDFL